MPQLVVNGDDLGFSPGVNRGVLKGHQDGIVTSTTVMMNMPFAEQGLTDALTHAPHLGIGVHVNLCEGRPVCDPERVSTLVDDDGYFFPPDELMQAAMQFAADELHAEIAAQIERFVQISGQNPTHLDAHYHVSYLHPFALEAKLALAREYGNLPLRNFNPFGDDTLLIKQLSVALPGVDSTIIRQILPMLRDVFASAPTPPHMPTVFETGFWGDHTALGDLLNILVTLPQATPVELLCHPGIGPDPHHPKIERREHELTQLTHATTMEVIERYNIELIHYGHLGAKETT